MLRTNYIPKYVSFVSFANLYLIPNRFFSNVSLKRFNTPVLEV